MRQLLTALIFLGFAPCTQGFELKMGEPFSQDYNLNESTTLNIENRWGSIQIDESLDDKLTVSATYEGQEPAAINVERPRTGLFKVSTSVTNSSGITLGSGGAVVNNSGSVVISGGGGTVTIDGRSIHVGPGTTVITNGEISSLIHIAIKMPRARLANLRAFTVAGDVVVNGEFVTASNSAAVRTRRVQLNSTSGDVKVSGLYAGGLIEIASISGGISLASIRGPLHATSTSGGIQMWTSNGDVTAKNVSGFIAISAHLDGVISVQTVSGDIRMNNPHESVTESAKTISGKVQGLKAAKPGSDPFN